MEYVVGIRKFGNKVDITDPCYDSNVWCRMNDVEILPGEYECFVDFWDNDQTMGWGRRVAVLGIRQPGTEEMVFKRIGEIGVDAGLAGIFEGKPDYDNAGWAKFCDGLWPRAAYGENDFYWLRDVGFFSQSGYGDGCYPVYAAKNDDGKVIAIEIRFIIEEDDD